MFERYSEENNIALDHAQLRLVKQFERYAHKIAKSKTHIFSRVLSKFKHKEHSKQGIYIFGDVGRGKSMLMNLFFDSLDTDKKLKVHFHTFMQDMHKNLHKWREQHSYTDKAYDPIPEIANKLADKYQVICFDELQVNNIADAMILYRLFKVFYDRKLYIFFTSNRNPDDLFKDGLQREHFIPFIDLIKKNLTVFELDSHQDYRLTKLTSLKRAFITPMNTGTRNELSKIVEELTGHIQKNSQQLVVGSGKKIHALNIYGNLAEFTFTELCVQPLGAIDYLSLARQFGTIIIHNIPKLTKDEHNEALRFITLIDCLYESKTKLICLSEVTPDKIYCDGNNAFEFKRTVSRLLEMGSHDYLASVNVDLV